MSNSLWVSGIFAPMNSDNLVFYSVSELFEINSEFTVTIVSLKLRAITTTNFLN
jgi:hypothetical protein